MIKILVLTWWREDYMSYRQHLGTLKLLSNKCEYVVCSRKDLMPYRKNLKQKFDELDKIHEPDVVIGYSGMEFHGQDLFSDMKCLKVGIEPDYHNFFGREDWFNEQFDILALRNGNTPIKFTIPTFWWPWSADPIEFFPGPKKRQNIIGFAGSSVHELYYIRKRAKSELERFGMLDDQKKLSMRDETSEGPWIGTWTDQGKYQKYLRSIKAILTSTENRGPFAKMFEAMASKTAVLTSPILNTDLLFGNDECYAEYGRDCSNINEVARKLLSNDDYAKEITNNAYKIFKRRHTTIKRVDELFINIQRTLEGKGLLKMWGF